MKKLANKWLWLIGALAVVVFIILLIEFLLNHFVDESYLEQRLTRALAAASDSLYRVEIGEVDFSLLQRSVTARNLALHPDSSLLKQSLRMGSLPAVRYAATVASLYAGGISLWSLLHKDLQLRELYLRQPEVHLVKDNSQSASKESRDVSTSEDMSRATDSKQSRHLRMAKKLPHITIGTVEIDRASFFLEVNDGKNKETTEVEQIFVWLDQVAVDSAAVDSSRPLFSDNVRLRIHNYHHISADSLYQFDIASIHAVTKDRFLVVDSLHYAPTVSDSVFMRRQTRRVDRYILAFKTLTSQGVDYWRFLEQAAVDVKSIMVMKPLADIYHDRHLPKPPKKPATLPHQYLQALKSPVCVDTIEIEQGTIRYSERAPDGLRPGTVSFEDLWSTVYNVSNDSDCLQSDMLAIIDVRSLLYGKARLEAKIEYELSGRHLTIAYRGTLGETDARIFNEMLVDLERTKITSGHVDSVWFDIEVKQDSAKGNLTMIYNNFKFEFMEKENGGKGLLRKLIELIVGSAINARNPPEDGSSPRVAAIRLGRKPEFSIFTFMWFTLRQGLMSTIGL